MVAVFGEAIQRLSWIMCAAVVVVALLASGCSQTGNTAKTATAAQTVTQSAPVETDVPDPAVTPESAPAEPTAIPEPTTAPGPTQVSDPDRDNDGVLNETDDFPDDATRSVALVSQFPLVGGINQLDENLPSVQALRQLQAVVLEDQTDLAALESIFAPSFLQTAAAAELVGFLDEARSSSQGTWEVVDVRSVTQWWLWVQLGDPAAPTQPTHLLRVGVDPNTGLINEAAINNWFLGLQTQQYQADRGKQLGDVVNDLATKSQFVGVLVAEVSSTGCRTIAGHNEDVPLGTGSIYKQWVLGAAATEINAGRLEREQVVTFAPGEFMIAGALTTSQFASTFHLTLQQAANLMMNRSDNGATDMVERIVGRQAGWDFVENSGHTEPDLLNPMIGVRDYDHLYSSVSQEQVNEYVGGTEDAQEAFILDVLEPLGPTSRGMYSNSDAREFSWQASPLDICETGATLATSFAPNSPAGMFIDEAYSGEVALFGVRNEWERTWSKGGGIPGSTPGTRVVFTNSYLVQSNSGEAFSVVIMLNSEEGFKLDSVEIEVASLTSRIFEILAAGEA